MQSYLTLPTPLGDMLAEARGYRLSLCLAHQHLGQLPREMREALAANARTKLYFQLSPHDAHALGRELEPELGDDSPICRATAAVRLAAPAKPAGPSPTTEPLPADSRPGRRRSGLGRISCSRRGRQLARRSRRRGA